MAKVTNISEVRFSSRGANGFRLMPKESLEVTAVHATCYLGHPNLKVEFTSDDSLDELSDLRLLSLNRVLDLENELSVAELKKHLIPKRRLKASIPKKKSTPKVAQKPQVEK